MGALVTTMQTWQDQMQLVMPGFRDRIVHVSHRAEEGGLNLNMDPNIIAVLADSGIQAANELIRAFAEGGGIANPNAWDNHRRIRVRSLLSLIQQGLEAIANGLGQPSHPGWDEMVVNPDPPSYPFKPTQIAAGALTLLHALEALASSIRARIASGVVTTGLKTTRTGICGISDRPWAIWREWSATC